MTCPPKKSFSVAYIPGLQLGLMTILNILLSLLESIHWAKSFPGAKKSHPINYSVVKSYTSSLKSVTITLLR